QYSIAIAANTDRNRRGEEHHHHFPRAGGPAGRAGKVGKGGHGQDYQLRTAGNKIGRWRREMVSEDTEITLGLGRMLGLFFLLVAICGVFLSIGYSLGKSTAREQALNDQPTEVLAASPPTTTTIGSSEEKPAAAVTSKPDTGPPGQDQATASNPQSNLTFYKAVQQNGAHEEPAAKNNLPAITQKASAGTETAASIASSAAKQATEAAGHGANPTISHAAPVTGPGTVVVQIAALSREDDAVALAGAL